MEIQPSTRPALLVIDLQRWFLEVGSKEKLASVARLIEKTNELIAFFNQRKLPVIKIQTVHKADKSTWDQWALANNVGRLIEDSYEAEYSPAILTFEGEVLLTKTRVSAFIRTDLEAQLHRLDCNQVVIVGYSTNSCVGQTAIAAYEYDFEVLLAGEAILGTNQVEGQLMLDYLEKRYGILPMDNSAIKLDIEKRNLRKY